MECVKIINTMRTMHVGDEFDLEALHSELGGKLNHGRPQMLLLPMSNGRNVQLFRRGTAQLLGRLTEDEAQGMRRKFLQRLQITTASPLVIHLLPAKRRNCIAISAHT